MTDAIRMCKCGKIPTVKGENKGYKWYEYFVICSCGRKGSYEDTKQEAIDSWNE